MPFSVLNYAAGASAVPPSPYGSRDFGLIPGTAAVVILGDALTGSILVLALVSLGTASVGAAGLAYEIRRHRRHHAANEADSGPASTAAVSALGLGLRVSSPGGLSPGAVRAGRWWHR